MEQGSSRRKFLAAGLAFPVAASASRGSQPEPQAPPARPAASAPTFTYRTLGKTGLKVTTVGFGCMITSDGSVVERGADLGITYFDTARSYQNGNNERMVGAALKKKRKDIVLSTKTGAKTKADALAHIDTSLKELGTDYVDIWYLHGKSSIADVTDDLVDAQQTAKQAGKIRFAGVSTHANQATLVPALAKHPQIDVILSAFNFTMEPAVAAALEEASKAGKGIVAMKVMAGRLRPDDPHAAIMKRGGAQFAALKWVTKNQFVNTCIPSMTDNDQLDENLKAMASSFTPADEKILAAHLEQIRPLYCNMCGACDGQCRLGLPVQDVLRVLTYADGYGQFGLARERYGEFAPEHANAKCAECPGCTVECPRGVKVAERLIKAQELFAC